ncbi:metal-dependent hydrolase [Mycobacterium sp.]|uniref:metal-dependent hydrolase n=1 Tax=Mycobacterium sp. TaxID=1785 RepID=UPI003D6AFD7C
MTDLEAHHDGYPVYRRKVRFDWSNTPLHWVPDDPFATHMINVLHLLLPAGERWFIEVVNEAAPMVDDPELQAAIKPFIQQEAWHAWAHQMVLDHLADQGIDTTPYTDRLQKWLSMLGKQRERWPRVLQRWSLYYRLADVAALEHFTAVLGQWVIQNRGLDYAGADPVMLDLLRWHGAEEIEHRSLVFDVYQNLCGNYPLRAFSMLMTSAQFIFFWLAGVRYLMVHDPTIGAKPRWRDWFRAARQYRVPGPWKLIVTVPIRYLRPRHHPSTEASTQMALDYLAHSPAARVARERANAKSNGSDG